MGFSVRLSRLPASNFWQLTFSAILFAIFYLLLGITPVGAQTSTTTSVGSTQTQTQDQPPSYYPPALNPDVPRDQHSLIQSAVIETTAAIICQLGGADPIRPGQKCLGVDPKTGKIGFVENGGGMVGVMGKLMTYTISFPISSSDYVNYLAGNFGISKKTYAQGKNRLISACATKDYDNSPQGIGFCGIQPLVGIWVGMRNIVYFLFVIIFVIIGIAIMLRVHIDPRTVMTIENQIPKIIAGIILVTFSFAIAGFLVDVMYISIYLVGGVLSSLPEFPSQTVKFGEVATSPTPVDALGRLWPGGGFGDITRQGTETFINLVNLAFSSGDSFDIDRGFDIFGDWTKGLASLILGIFATLFIFLGLIFVTLRLWLMMIISYINILLDIVFAPFWFLIGLLPGSSVGVGAWFKDMVANLAVYPTALSMLILGKIFGEIAGNASDQIFFTPPLAGAAGGAGGDGVGDAFAGFIMLGFIFMTPHVLQITRNAIKAPVINWGPVFQPIGAGAGAFGAGASSMVTAITPALPKTPGAPGGLTAVFRKWFKA